MLGVPTERCPHKILLPEEFGQFSDAVQEIQDACLERIWGRIRSGIRVAPDFPEELLLPLAREVPPFLRIGGELIPNLPLANPQEFPDATASAGQIRGWMHASARQGALQGIRQLNLNDLHLTCVPGEMRLCTRVNHLYLSTNQLHSLPGDCFRELASLEYLSLSANRLHSLPVSLFHGLTSLQMLFLPNNRLHSLPPNLFQGLISLRGLYLANNPLHSLPENLFQGLNSLRSLSLANTQLHSLPANLFQGLTSLEFLNLSNNQLHCLPATLFHGLTSLQDLLLQNNAGLHSQLLFFYKDVPTENESRVFPWAMNDFFNHPSESTLARWYQMVAANPSPEMVWATFWQLPQDIRDTLSAMIGQEASPSTTEISQGRALYAWNDMGILARVFRDYVSHSFHQLTAEQQNAVYGHVATLAQISDDPQWGKLHAFDNIPRLIDAMMRVHAFDPIPRD